MRTTPRARTTSNIGRLASIAVVGLLVVAGCSDSDSDDTASTASSATSAETTSTEEAPPSDTDASTTITEPADTAAPTTAAPSQARSAVDLSAVVVTPIPAGAGVAQSSATEQRGTETFGLPALSPSYVEAEYLVSGVADTYTGSVLAAPSVATEDSPYTTRILVRRPADPADFSGRVVLEPFNTSGTADFDALWGNIGPLLESNGDAWVGVTDRYSGATQNVEFDPVRYADLNLPTNDFAWDILRQVGGLIKEGNPQSPLADLPVEFLYMGGYSQSAVEAGAFASAFGTTTTMDDATAIYDGYLPVGRSASLTNLQSGTAPLPGFEFAAMAPPGVPVLDVETQTDVEGFEAVVDGVVVYTNPGSATVRREDSDAESDPFRLYELPGAPHAKQLPGCDGDGSSFPTEYFVQAAASQLFGWAEMGVAPPNAARIDLATIDVVSVAAVDEFGNALGGIRSPFLDVPLVRYEVHSSPGPTCKLGGNETPLPADVLATRYAGVDAYLDEFADSLDATIAAGFLLERDREAILAAARAKAEGLLPSA